MNQLSSSRQFRIISAITLVLLVATAGPAAAQQLTGSIEGRVTDATGGALPGVTMELVNPTTKIVVARITGSSGQFVFSGVRPGPYDLNATLSGFQKARRRVEVQVNLAVKITVALQLASIEQAVEVTAEVPALDFVNAQAATNVGSKIVTTLPSINRDVTQLVELMPGARAVEGTTSGGSQVVDISGNYAVGNGTRRSQSLFYVDGSENMGTRRNQALQMPNPDTVEQVQVVTSTSSAEFGKQPGISMNLITKSGTNTFHGTALYAFHDGSLNANTWAANRAGQEVPDDKQRWMNATIGGPILRDKLFFFTSYQRYEDNQPSSQSGSRMPTEAMMSGDFSAIPGFSIKAVDPKTGKAIGAVIPSYLFNPIAAQMKGRFPTIGAYNNVDRYYWGFNRDVYNNEYLAKLDWALAQNQQVALSYMGTLGEQNRPDNASGLTNNIPGWGGDISLSAQQHTGSLRHSWLPSSSFSVDSRFAMGYLDSGRTRADLDENIETLGGRWPTVAPGVLRTLPSVFFSGGPTARGGQISDTVQENYRFLSTGSWFKGNHTVKLGAEIQYQGYTRYLNYDNSQIYFTGAYANTSAPLNGPWKTLSSPSGDNQFAYAWADFLLGRTSRAVATGVTDDEMKGMAYFFFLNDEWRLSPRLTLSAGLRYELYGNQSSKALLAGYVEGHQSDQYPTAPLGMAFEGDAGIPEGFREGDTDNFAPRLGIAWDALGNGKLAVRAGWGLYYAYPPLNQMELLSGTYGASTITANHGNLTDAWGTARANSGDTACQFTNCQAPDFNSDPSRRVWTPASVSGFDTSLETPYQHQWNIGGQYELLPGLVGEAAYVGSRGKGSFVVLDDNLAVWAEGANTGNVNARRPNQLYRTINITYNIDDEKYDAGQFSLTYRRPKVYARLTYTLQNSYALGGAEGQEVGITNSSTDWLDNPRDPMGELALAASRNVIRGAFSVDSPDVKGSSLVQALLNNWQLGFDITWLDGENINVTLGSDWNYDGFAGDRPNLTGPCEMPKSDVDGVTTWITRDCFAAPNRPDASDPYSFGDYGRNGVRGPSRLYANATLAKTIRLTSPLLLQLRLDARNVFNHPVLSNPNLNLSSTDFGLIRTKEGGGRVLQLGIKLIF